MRRQPLTLKRLLLVAALLLLVTLIRTYLLSDGGAPPVAPVPSGSMSVEEVARNRLSEVMLTVEGRVQRTLADDNDGSRHQRFILETDSGHTVLVAHNIDLAPKVPLASGDRVEVHGQFEWNERGGVVHWTHHDPAGRHEEGWIRHQGRKYE